MLFGWRKRNEGFEWREYVRTTILVRRADRQKRIDDVRLAAVAKVKDAKDRGVEAGLKQVDAVRGGAKAGVHKAGHALADGAMNAARMFANGAGRMAAAAGQRLSALPRPEMPPRLKNSGATLAMYAADIPRRWRLAKPYLLPVAGAAAAIFVFGTALAPQTSGVPVAGAVSSPKTPIARSEQKTIAANADGVIIGRASAVSGDLLRVSGRLVRLAGIDAPQPAQSCTKSNGRRWACAASAVSALGRLVRGRKISCELKEKSGDGPDLAHCRAGDDDLATLLVRKGHVFASADFNGLYASDEETAKAEKLGVWQGETERPDAWRAKIWDEAKRSAPDGCPIKGFVRAGGRVYSMPWSEGYTGRNIKTVKGERWFCSEDEARAAGFRLSSRS